METTTKIVKFETIKQLVADEFGSSEVVDASNLTEWVEYYYGSMPVAVSLG